MEGAPPVAVDESAKRRGEDADILGTLRSEEADMPGPRTVGRIPTPTEVETKRDGGGKNRPRVKINPVEDAIARLGATAETHGEVYNACSHTYLMVRDSATLDLGVQVEKGNMEALERLLLQMQDTSEGFVREQAAKVAGTCAMNNDDVFNAILPLLEHEDNNVRRTALIAVKKRLHSDRVVVAARDALEGRVKELDRELRAIDAVRKRFEDVNGRCRFAAVDAFAKLIGQFHYEAVASANMVLEDDEEWVRRFSADLLGKALISCQNFFRGLSQVAIPNVIEGFNELIGAGIRCYEVGLTLNGGGDAYMRRIAVQGLCVVATSAGVCHFGGTSEKEESVSKDVLSRRAVVEEGGDLVPNEPSQVDRIYYSPQDAIKILWKALKDDVTEIRKAEVSEKYTPFLA